MVCFIVKIHAKSCLNDICVCSKDLTRAVCTNKNIKDLVILRHLPSITYLNLRYNHLNIKTTDFHACSTQFPNLQLLDFRKQTVDCPPDATAVPHFVLSDCLIEHVELPPGSTRTLESPPPPKTDNPSTRQTSIGSSASTSTSISATSYIR